MPERKEDTLVAGGGKGDNDDDDDDDKEEEEGGGKEENVVWGVEEVEWGVEEEGSERRPVMVSQNCDMARGKDNEMCMGSLCCFLSCYIRRR